MARGGGGLARDAPLAAAAVARLTTSAFVGGAPGLELRISKGGTRAWRLFYRLPGGSRRRAMALGRYPGVTLADARKRANEALALASAGIDPSRKIVVGEKAAPETVEAALESYLASCAVDNDASTLIDKRSAFRNHILPQLGSRPLLEVSRAQWVERVDALQKHPGIRRCLFAYLRHFLNWAVERDHLPSNPLSSVRAPRPVAARERVLTDEEILALWRLEGDVADLSRLALLTAQRQGSLASLTWPQVDRSTAIWSIPGPNMKSGAPHLVPLSPTALAVLARRPRFTGPFVFGVGSNGQRPFNGFSNGMENLRRLLSAEADTSSEERDVEPWRFHDLRRTAVTLAQRGGAPLDSIRALTQHKSAGVIGVYARHAFADEKRIVVNAIEGQLQRICGPTDCK